jgi:hypothetical protein
LRRGCGGGWQFRRAARAVADDLVTPVIGHAFPFADFFAGTEAADAETRLAVDSANVDAR